MIALYYRIVKTGTAIDHNNVDSATVSQQLHLYTLNEFSRYGITKGKVLHVHLRKNDGIIEGDIITLRGGQVKTSAAFLSSTDVDGMKEMVQAYLKNVTNSVLFFVIDDTISEEYIKILCKPLKIKRKKYIDLENIGK